MKKFLIKNNACPAALDWVGNRTMQQAIADCHNPMWLLWLLDKLGADVKYLKRAHIAVVEVSLMHLPIVRPEIRRCVQYAKDYLSGNADSVFKDTVPVNRVEAAVWSCSNMRMSRYQSWQDLLMALRVSMVGGDEMELSDAIKRVLYKFISHVQDNQRQAVRH